MAANPVSSISHNAPIARVAALHGEVFAKGQDGVLRPLHLGDPIFDADVLVTRDGSSVEVVSIDGHSVSIAGNETLTVDADVFASAPPEIADAAIQVDQADVSKVIQAINEGGSLDQLLEETAAGNAIVGSDGGSTFVRLLRIAEGVDPLSYSFETARAAAVDDPISGGNTVVPESASTGGSNAAPPVAGADALSTAEDTPLTFDPRANDISPDGYPLAVTQIAGQLISVGQPVVLPQGSVALNADGSLTFTPDANYNGPASFTYAISDGHGGSSTATVNLTINPVADLSAGNDLGSGLEDTTIHSSVTANDSTTSGGVLSYVKASDPAHGSVIVDANGDYHYTPNANYHGADSFTYTVTDVAAGESLTRTVDLTVAPVNDPPIAVNDSIATVENAAVTVAVLSNDSDIDGDPLTVASVTQGANGSVVVDPLSGNPIYTPNRGYHGNDSFTYTIDDGQGGSSTATVNVVVGSVNDAPVTQPDSNTTPEDTAVSSILPLQANDTDLDGDSLSVLAGSFTTTQGGTIVIAADGNYTYTPPANFHGTDTFNYTVTDGSASDVGTLTLTVTPVNDAPAAIDDALTTAEDAALTITPATLLANDSDIDGDPLTIASAQNATHGTVALVGGNVVFTPDADYHGPASFTYTISDGQGGTSTATVNIDVTPINDPPVAVADTVSTLEDTPVVVPVLSNDSDVDGDTLTVSNVTQGAHGNVVIDPSSGNPVYTPNANYHGVDTFTYTISDGHGGSSTATVNLTIDAIADLAAGDDTNSGPEDVVINGSVIANDSTTSGGALSYTKASDPAHGTVVVDANGDYHYTPAANYHGADSFTYTVTDTVAGESLTRTVSLTVTPVNDPPLAVNDTASTNEDTPLTLIPSTLLGNDSDVDGDTLTITSVQEANNGTVALVGGNVVFTPDSNFHGPAGFTYTISDGHGGTSTATVDVQVAPVADLNALDDTGSGPKNMVITGNVGFNDDTTSGGSLAYVKAGDPAHGTVVVDANGDYHYTPNTNYVGTDSFTYTVTDATAGESLTRTVNLTLTKAEAIVTITSIAGDDVVDGGEARGNVSIVGTVGGEAKAGDEVSTTINGHLYTGTVATDGVSYSIAGVAGSDLLAAAGQPVRVNLTVHDVLGNAFVVHADHDYSTAAVLSATTSAVAPATAGLHAEYYGYNDGTNSAYKTHADDRTLGNLDSISDMQTIINGRNGGNTVVGSIVAAGADVPDAVFQATAINYGYINGSLGTNTSGTHKLNEFLHATDAATLVGTVGQTTDAGIRFIGYLDSPAGSYDIRIHSDDGFRLMIDGTSVADFNGIRSPGNSFVTNVSLHGGLSPIEILYWDQAGEAVLHIEFKPAGAPDSAYADLGTGDLALVSPDFTQVLTPLQDIIADPAHAGQYLIRTGQEYTGTHGVDHITGGDGRDSIHGGAGNDIIDGGANDDQIDGGAGHDHLTGGLGSDVFVWHLGDQGTQGNPAIDTISDFSASSASGSKDVLDLRDLLQGENHTTGTGNLSDYLHFEKSGADTIVHVSSTGGFATDSHAVGGVYSSGHEDQSIILHNVDLVGVSTADQNIIQDLLTNGKLLTH